jgi:putative transposase
MPQYRRADAPGATFFFTLVTERRAPILCSDAARPILRHAMHQTQERWPFVIEAIVLLRDHLHTLWTLPPEDSAYSRRWGFLKKTFTQAWLGSGGAEQPVTVSRQRHRRRGVLQRKFWEHTIRDERDFARHLDYIHYNPVKHGLASCPHAWPYSTFRRWVAMRAYDPDWQCVCGRQAASPLPFDDLDQTAME